MRIYCVLQKFFRGASFAFFRLFRTAYDRRAAGYEIERVLVQDAGHSFIEFGKLVTERYGAFEKYLHCNGPELMIVRSCIVAEKIFGAAFPLTSFPLLHGCEDGTGDLGEIGKFLLEMFVLLCLSDKVDICKGVSHFMEPDITIGRLAGDPFHKIIPGEIDTGLVYMPHKGTGIKPIMIVIPQDEDIIEIVQLEFFQAEGQLNSGSADQDGHFSRFLYLYIVKILGVLEEIGAEKEFPLLFEIQSVVISEMPGDDRVIKSFPRDETLELVSVVKTLKEERDRTIQEKYPNYQ